MTRSRSKKAPGSGKAKMPSATKEREAVAAMLRGHDGAETILSVFDALANERDGLANERDAMAAEYERQELRIKKLQLLLYGRRTEKLTAEELQQLVLSFGASEEQAAKPDPEVPVPEAPGPSENEGKDNGGNSPEGPENPGKKRRKRRACTEVDPEVERVVDVVPVPAEERTCACCQQEMEVIDYIERRWLEFVPARFIEHVERREKLACRQSQCRGDIHAAERSEGSPERRKVDAGLLAQLVEAKCSDGLPVDRQRDMFARLGVAFPLNTLYTYWTYVTTLLLPVAKIVLAQVLADSIVGLDDTKLRILNKGSPGGSYKACLWCFTGTGPLVAFTMTRSWKAADIAEHIAAIGGFMQCDDYKGYSSTVEMPGG